MEIISIEESHYPELCRIYLDGIATGHATFQVSAPSWEEWHNNHLGSCRLCAVENDQMLGWVALTPVSSRCVYAGVAEISIYVDQAQRGKGIGDKLMKQVIEESEKAGLWTLQAGIFPENISSIQLHKNNGFRIIGTRERIGNMNGIWRDNLILERRSNKVGI